MGACATANKDAKPDDESAAGSEEAPAEESAEPAVKTPVEESAEPAVETPTQESGSNGTPSNFKGILPPKLMRRGYVIDRIAAEGDAIFDICPTQPFCASLPSIREAYVGRNTKSGERVFLQSMQPVELDVLRQSIKKVMTMPSDPNLFIITGHATRADKAFFVVYPYFEGADVFTRLSEAVQGKSVPWTESDLAKLLRPLFLALAHLHENGMAHCELAPRNLIMVKDTGTERLVLVDLGLSKFDKPASTAGAADIPGMIGDLRWAPPEQMEGGQYDTMCADVYSCGLIVCAMLFGAAALSPARCGKNGLPRPPYRGETSASMELEDLLTHMVAPSKVRWTMPQVLKHRWWNLQLEECVLASSFESNVQPFTRNAELNGRVGDWHVIDLTGHEWLLRADHPMADYFEEQVQGGSAEQPSDTHVDGRFDYLIELSKDLEMKFFKGLETPFAAIYVGQEEVTALREAFPLAATSAGTQQGRRTSNGTTVETPATQAELLDFVADLAEEPQGKLFRSRMFRKIGYFAMKLCAPTAVQRIQPVGTGAPELVFAAPDHWRESDPSANEFCTLALGDYLVYNQAYEIYDDEIYCIEGTAFEQGAASCKFILHEDQSQATFESEGGVCRPCKSRLCGC